MAKFKHRILGVVLAGGRSSRMGRDKALLHYSSPYGSLPWIDQMIQILRSVPCDEVRISGSYPEWNGIPDRISGLGPLGGLATIVPTAVSFSHLVAVPVDMPRLVPEMVQALLLALNRTEPHHADAAIFQDHPLPWVCRLSHRFSEKLASLCAPSVPSRKRSFRELSHSLTTLALPASKRATDRLRNFNTPKDLEELFA